MDHFLVDDYRKEMQKEIIKYSEYLATGKAETYDRYREVAGKIAGLKEALDIFKRCVKAHGDEEDE